jgi:hypothetical protein
MPLDLALDLAHALDPVAFVHHRHGPCRNPLSIPGQESLSQVPIRQRPEEKQANASGTRPYMRHLHYVESCPNCGRKSLRVRLDFVQFLGNSAMIASRRGGVDQRWRPKARLRLLRVLDALIRPNARRPCRGAVELLQQILRHVGLTGTWPRKSEISCLGVAADSTVESASANK